jgi:hypothetical protein
MPRRLSIILLASLLCGIALANESNDNDLANVTLTCSVGTSGSVVCFAERPVLTLGSFELALGVDARVILYGIGAGHVTGYAILGWYEPTWNAWLELAVPELIPPIGKNDFLRVGFTVRF